MAAAAAEQTAPPQRTAPQRVENDREAVTGIEQPAREPGDTARDAAEAVLFIPRELLDLVFEGTAAAAGLIRNEHLVPRYREALTAPGGTIIVFPTAFVETGSTASIGARMIAQTRYLASTYRIGYGGPDDVVFEARLRLQGQGRLPYALAIEGLYELESEIEYRGLGQRPESDPRNHFRPDNPQRVGLYAEDRLRGIASLGLRPSDELELFASTSLYRRTVEDSPDGGEQALTRVFAPESTPGANRTNVVGYVETAMRFDSRPTRGKPSPGALVEVYAGRGFDVLGDPVRFARAGWRVAGYIPLYRQSNILSPRLLFDHLIPLGGLAVPFVELPRQPDFRGFDTRRDELSVVASLDYTWGLLDFMGARIFVDAATVAPGLDALELEHLEHLRFAGGLGIDLYTSTDTLAQLAVSVSGDGPRLLLSLGVPSNYGDRQHRD